MKESLVEMPNRLKILSQRILLSFMHIVLDDHGDDSDDSDDDLLMYHAIFNSS